MKELWGELCLIIVFAAIFYRSVPGYSIATVLSYCLYLASRYRARRRIKPPGELSVESLPDDAVLYLRPFDADFIRGAPAGPLYEPDEVLLASAFKTVGPFVAVGNPREGLPSVGAQRIYIEGGWREFIAAAMVRARLVVIHIGGTESLLWEMRCATQRLGPEKLLLLVPAGEEDYEAFRRQAQPILPLPLPAYPPHWPPSRSDFKGLIRFESDWTPRFLPFRWACLRGGWDDGLRRAAQAALRPVCAGLGIPWRRPSINWLRVIILFGLTFLAFFLFRPFV